MEEEVAAAIDSAVAAGEVTGAVIALVRKGELIGVRASGLAEVQTARSVHERSPFSVMSVTKPVVATAVMRLVEQGALGLDDPVNHHLGSLTLKNPWERERPVTIRHLLTHTGGLPVTTVSDASSIEEEVSGYTTEWAPGTRLIYANGGYNVLGCVLAHLTERPWDEAVAEMVLRPLGMRSSGFPTPTETESDRAVGHVISQVDGSTLALAFGEPYFPPPASGSLVATAEDLARFLIAHLDTSMTVTEQMRRKMHALQVPAGPGGGGMGLGFRIERRLGSAMFCHGGDGAGFTTFIGGLPAERVGLVLLLNTGHAGDVRSAIVTTALSALVNRLQPPKKASQPPVIVADRFASTFWDIQTEVSVDGPGPTIMAFPGPVVVSGSSTELVPEDGRWIGKGGYFDGWPIDFEVGPDGAKFYGGVYPLAFHHDDRRVITLPDSVDSVVPWGDWSGTVYSPFGPIPLELELGEASAHARSPVFEQESFLTDLDLTPGRVSGRFEVAVPGMGAFTIAVRLGLIEERLDGMLYAQGVLGEFPMSTSLDRSTRQERPNGPD